MLSLKGWDLGVCGLDVLLLKRGGRGGGGGMGGRQTWVGWIDEIVIV